MDTLISNDDWEIRKRILSAQVQTDRQSLMKDVELGLSNVDHINAELTRLYEKEAEIDSIEMLQQESIADEPMRVLDEAEEKLN